VSAVAIEYTLFVLYVALGPVMWLLFGLSMYERRAHMRLAKRPHPPLPEPPPRATILIPAKDEGERIRDCIQSALAQKYPDFEVVTIDDRSTDTTGAVMDEIAASNPKLKVLHVRQGELREGWTGKCNALHIAVTREVDPRSQWLLFVDSDTVIAPDALAASVMAAINKRAELFSLLPVRLECHTFWEKLLIPLAGMGIATMYLVAMTNNDHWPKNAFANGQFLLIRRDTYDAIGGHERVRDKFCEDVELARLLKLQGRRVRIGWGTEFATVRMYSSLAAIFRGWGRSFYAGSLGRPWRIMLGILFVIACCWSVWAVLPFAWIRHQDPINFFGGYGWLGVAAAHLFFMTYFVAKIYAWSGNRARLTFLFPTLGAGMMVLLWLKALKFCFTHRIEWRGTSYSHRMTPGAHTTAQRNPAG